MVADRDRDNVPVFVGIVALIIGAIIGWGANTLANYQSTSGGGQVVGVGGAPAERQTQAEDVINVWSGRSREEATKLIGKYGQPTEITRSHLIWYNQGPWKKTVIYRDEVAHNFPTPHTDLLEQTIDYRVPDNKLNDLAEFDGSLSVNQTRGEITAFGPSEEMNLIALNLAHEIINDQMSVGDARQTFAETARALAEGRSNPNAERFQFTVALGGTADPDQSVQ